MFRMFAMGRFYIGLFLLTVKRLIKKDYVKRSGAYVFYVDRPLLNFKGMSAFSFIWIMESSRLDSGLLVHEVTHVKQWRRYRWKILKALLDKGFVLKLEVEAYRAQIEAGADARVMARHLATKYGFGISRSKAFALLMGGYR